MSNLILHEEHGRDLNLTREMKEHNKKAGGVVKVGRFLEDQKLCWRGCRRQPENQSNCGMKMQLLSVTEHQDTGLH